MARPRIHPHGIRTSIHGIIRPPGAQRIPAGNLHTGLLVGCWCEQYHDYINPRDIANGQTWTCGAPNCKPPEDAA
jgi:hypothetical protein